MLLAILLAIVLRPPPGIPLSDLRAIIEPDSTGPPDAPMKTPDRFAVPLQAFCGWRDTAFRLRRAIVV